MMLALVSSPLHSSCFLAGMTIPERSAVTPEYPHYSEKSVTYLCFAPLLPMVQLRQLIE